MDTRMIYGVGTECTTRLRAFLVAPVTYVLIILILRALCKVRKDQKGKANVQFAMNIRLKNKFRQRDPRNSMVASA